MSWLDKYDSSNKQSEENHKPTMQDAMNEVKKRPGMSYQQVFYQMCKERGVDPNGPINTLTSLLGGKK